MIKYSISFAALGFMLLTQVACTHGNMRNFQSESLGCEDDPLDYYHNLPVLSDMEPSAKASNAKPIEKNLQDCLKLRRATKLSFPGSDHQNDQKALVMLNELKQKSSLSGRDLRFAGLLLQHVSQRQKLRNLIGAQEKRQIKLNEQNVELKNQLETLQSQLDQLKNIEIEIDKKERSVISPIDE